MQESSWKGYWNFENNRHLGICWTVCFCLRKNAIIKLIAAFFPWIIDSAFKLARDWLIYWGRKVYSFFNKPSVGAHYSFSPSQLHTSPLIPGDACVEFRLNVLFSIEFDMFIGVTPVQFMFEQREFREAASDFSDTEFHSKVRDLWDPSGFHYPFLKCSLRHRCGTAM